MKQLIKFLLAGGIAALLNWSSRILFSQWLAYELAIVLAFGVGLISGFVLMRFYVFNKQFKPVIPQASKYLLVNLFALLQTLGISLLLARYLLPRWGNVEHIEAIAHGFGVLFPVVTSYFGHKYLTYR